MVGRFESGSVMPKQKQILLINHYAGSPEHGMEFRPYYMAREWVRSGHDVTIVASRHSHLRKHDPSFSGAHQEEWIDGVRYLWLSTTPYRENGWRRAANMGSFVTQVLRYQKVIAQDRQFDAVIAASTYPMDMYAASRIAAKHGAKLVFEVHDLWPLTPVLLGGMSVKHPFIRLMQHAENFAYRRADLVVSLLPNAESHMLDHGLKPGKFHYIPNGVDIEQWDQTPEPMPELHQQTLDRLHTQDKLVVGYAGGLGLANAMEPLVHAAAQMQDAPVAFVVIGDGPCREDLRRQAEALRLDNLVFLPAIAKRSVPSFLQAVDVTFLSWQDSPLYKFGVGPNKLFDYMMAGKPVVQALNASNDLVSQAGCGMTVPALRPTAIANAVGELREMGAVGRQRIGARGQTYIRAHHDYRRLATQFVDLFRSQSYEPLALSRSA